MTQLPSDYNAKYDKSVVLQCIERFKLLLLAIKNNASAQIIRGLRATKNLTQKAAADLCDMDVRTYQRAEDAKAKSPPGLKILRQIANGYNVNIGILLGDNRPTIIVREHDDYDIRDCAKRVWEFVKQQSDANLKDRARQQIEIVQTKLSDKPVDDIESTDQKPPQKK